MLTMLLVQKICIVCICIKYKKKKKSKYKCDSKLPEEELYE